MPAHPTALATARMMLDASGIDALASANRILVLGPSGSGKTYLSRRLGKILGTEPLHLDARFWGPGWVSTPQPEWRRTVDALVRADRWIMDGTYESTLDLRIPAAEAIVVIDRPRWICLWGILRRTLIYRSGPRPDAPARQPIDLPFLRYIWDYPTRTRPVVDELISRHGREKCVIVLHGAREMKELLAEVDIRAARVAA